jgi:hypothetical protein
MKLIIGRIVSILIMAGGWVLVGIRTILDLIGYSTVPEDIEVAQTRLDQILGWVLSLPWWAPWGFALISTLWLMYVSWPRQRVGPAPIKTDTPAVQIEKPAYASRFAGKKQTSSTPEQKERQWPKTSEYDLPIKLRAIDDLLVIVGADKEYEETYREGTRLSQEWERKIKQGRRDEYLDRLAIFEQRCMAIHEAISQIMKDNVKYEDICYILSSQDSNNVIGPLRQFVMAIVKLGPNPSGEFQFFLKPFVDKFESGLKDFGVWRFKTEQALLARRKELSG